MSVFLTQGEGIYIAAVYGLSALTLVGLTGLVIIRHQRWRNRYRALEASR